MPQNLAELYRASMIPHRFGYALYEPARFTSLRPGMLGYLDEFRHWHPILDLTDPAVVAGVGYTPIGPLQRSDADTRRWGPRVSSNVKENRINLEGDLNGLSFGFPVDVGGVIQYSTKSDFGAVLMCDTEVVSEGYDFRSPFLQWIKKNSRTLLANYPDLKKHGVCAVTWTYSASDIHINAWTNSDNTVTVGFKLGAEGIGSANPEISWIRSQSSSGWMEWTGQKRVVFFTGVKMKYGLFGVRERPENEWRGEKDKFMITGLEGGQSCEAEAEFFGDDWGDIDDHEDDEEDNQEEQLEEAKSANESRIHRGQRRPSH